MDFVGNGVETGSMGRSNFWAWVVGETSVELLGVAVGVIVGVTVGATVGLTVGLGEGVGVEVAAGAQRNSRRGVSALSIPSLVA